ncbi:MAG TPA: hypothetical protein VG056_17470 [Pirellulales bacterium]|jgi:hypothetical protein|nr:hypothetical protein [Pirellulales bacterium]
MDDLELVRCFEDCTLPFEQWTHRCHVKVAYCYLLQFPFELALDRMRAGIKRYNAANQVPEGPTSGYNETTTQAFLRLVAVTIQAYSDAFPTPDADSFCEAHPQLMTRHVLRLFYSQACRMNPLAKTRFIEPDLAPLPTLPTKTTCR